MEYKLHNWGGTGRGRVGGRGAEAARVAAALLRAAPAPPRRARAPAARQVTGDSMALGLGWQCYR